MIKAIFWLRPITAWHVGLHQSHSLKPTKTNDYQVVVLTTSYDVSQCDKGCVLTPSQSCHSLARRPTSVTQLETDKNERLSSLCLAYVVYIYDVSQWQCDQGCVLTPSQSRHSLAHTSNTQLIIKADTKKHDYQMVCICLRRIIIVLI